MALITDEIHFKEQNLQNITEEDTLFEVDQAVNKIRAEVDPEAELIFGY